jgi:hypothetical protein
MGINSSQFGLCGYRSTDISFVRLFERTFENNLQHIHKLFSTYFHKFSR